LATATAEIAATDPGTSVRVPLFAECLAGLDESSRHVILDLGPARSNTLEAVDGLRCRLDILDLPELFDQQPVEPATDETGPDRLIHAISKRLPPQLGEQADLVFCWTLLNYLEPRQISGLFALLDRRLAPQVRIHALIESSATRMPAEPAAVGAQGREQILIESNDAASRPAPRYASGLLEKSMPGFKAERTMLLGNGMREYLFCRK